MMKLGEKYGLSGSGLRKICAAMNVPIPGRGHWAKIAAGHKIERPPLPSDATRTRVLANPPARVPTYEQPEDARWLAERVAQELRADSAIVVASPPRLWHPVLRVWRDELRAEAGKLEAARVAAESTNGYQ